MFEVLAISQELGLTELRKRCEEHITGTLSVANACDFLAAAVHMQSLTTGMYYHGDHQ